jgi:hypothetical protein
MPRRPAYLIPMTIVAGAWAVERDTIELLVGLGDPCVITAKLRNP